MSLARNSVVKFLAAVLAALSVCVSVVSFALVYYTTAYNGYSSGITFASFRNRIYSNQVYQDINEVQKYFALSLVDEDWARERCSQYAERFSISNSNFFFTVTNEDTEEDMLSNYLSTYDFSARMDTYVSPADYYNYNGPDEYYESSSRTYMDDTGTVMMEAGSMEPTFSVDEAGSADGTTTLTIGSAEEKAVDSADDSGLYHVIITGYVRDFPDETGGNTVVADEYYALNQTARLIFNLRYQAIGGAAGGAVLFLVCYIFLLYAAGRRKDTDVAQLRFVDHIPWDIYLALCIGMGVMVMVLGAMTGQFGSTGPFQSATAIGIGVLAAGESILLVAASMSIAARCKTPGWGKNSLIYWIWNGVGTLFHHPLRQLGYFITHLPLLWKTLLAGVIYIGLEILSLFPFYWDGNPVFLIALNVVAALVIVAGTVSMKRLQKAGAELAEGNMEYRVDTRLMYGDYRRHAENLNHIGDGISVAVEVKVKSERFRTELITNVSHDLKTPLTSIVNYVDLLSKLALPEDARAYVEVLQRQSNRLKKLTEDLVEASKASTGNLKVELGPVNLGELLVQVTGEYEDRLQKAGITPVVQAPEEPIYALGDGRYLWRIIDNLLSNVRKYALPGTRVYIDASELDGAAVISVKNVSRDRLNISADELMGRFVRGDASRNTEGSGLGLSIAQSLATLMHGKLTLTVDGDLFKAELSLQPAQPGDNPPEESAEN